MILFYMIYLQDQFEQLQKVFFVLLVKLKVFRVLSNILAKFWIKNFSFIGQP